MLVKEFYTTDDAVEVINSLSKNFQYREEDIRSSFENKLMQLEYDGIDVSDECLGDSEFADFVHDFTGADWDKIIEAQVNFSRKKKV